MLQTGDPAKRERWPCRRSSERAGEGTDCVQENNEGRGEAGGSIGGLVFFNIQDQYLGLSVLLSQTAGLS